ncbi:conserved hypothetical protein [Cellulomonas flavigena DSM 20109]|uniref:Uncharacterized protein n=1 Tax=Cellulomonas flavigena (strain ATCC 482 / DSM 20109 / BCRC 11376 / JCM 18109 / NBRC 3775 / NCIMB 8073 / NRS 134) TaxID=446466 RepID=D5UDP2_CELFN|nr:hypothetical protein [Cellulomonas flavigena]ADG76498.1 conserved hypothetical protein [Cellulomonas flavigena DSM 20109]
MIDYEGRVFRRAGGADAARARYHQSGRHVWAHVEGGPVVVGTLAGQCDDDGKLSLAYALALGTGVVVAGRTTNVPEVRADGSVVLREEWQRSSPDVSCGVSYLEEVRGAAAEPTEAREGAR